MIQREHTIDRTDFVKLNTFKCKACWKCLEKCPEVIQRAGFLWTKYVVVGHADKCTGCLKCVKTCPVGAFTPIAARSK